MGIHESYRSYAADCVRQADAAPTPEEKNVLLNVALAWVRLAQQQRAVADRYAVQNLDAVKEASAKAAQIDAKVGSKIINLNRDQALPIAQGAA